MSSRCVVNGIKFESLSVQTQLNYIYYIELHVLAYFRSPSASQLVFYSYWGRKIYFKSTKT